MVHICTAKVKQRSTLICESAEGRTETENMLELSCLASVKINGQWSQYVQDGRRMRQYLKRFCVSDNIDLLLALFLREDRHYSYESERLLVRKTLVIGFFWSFLLYHIVFMPNYVFLVRLQKVRGMITKPQEISCWMDRHVFLGCVRINIVSLSQPICFTGAI